MTSGAIQIGVPTNVQHLDMVAVICTAGQRKEVGRPPLLLEISPPLPEPGIDP
jgi:hypothetical protein